MAVESQCKFFKFGFCKFEDRCRERHVIEKCPDPRCTVLNCPLRHPRPCKYFRMFQNCKFGDHCAYEHQLCPIVEHLKEEIGKLKAVVEEKNEEVNNWIKETQAIQDKMEKSLEMKMKEIHSILEIQNKTIQDLKTNVSTKSSEAAATEPEAFHCELKARNV